ncbi:hypothetical protein DFH06DRAFT_1473988 [Mycena polygramma]|nr:hypothetical protein DFH06DRAFT_1473988 [Mycena polygramma]
MHDSLRLENLSLLPISIRRFATPAATGSVHDFQRLLEVLDDNWDEERYKHCLPVFYFTLDPAKIPMDENLRSDPIRCATMALDALRNVCEAQAHKPAWPDLWPRVWAWIVFLHAYRDCFPDDLGEPDVCLDLLVFYNCFGSDAATRVLISQTEGVRALVVDAWAFLLNTEERESHWGFSELCRALRDGIGIVRFNPIYPTQVAEIVDGADGPLGLASLVVKTLRALLLVAGETPTVVVEEKNLAFLQDVLSFLDYLPPHDAVPEALASAGISISLTAAAIGCIYGTHTSAPSATRNVVLKSLELLVRFISCPRAMQESIATGLLYAIIYIAMCPSIEDAHEQMLKRLLTRTLPGSTLYRSILASMEVQLLRYEPTTNTSDFQNSWLYDEWQSFATLAHERIAFMNELDSKKDAVAFRACDNMECGLIQERKKFKRCSACEAVYYCSLECRKVDWRHGGHRDTCQSIRAFALKKDGLVPRDRAFLRALLHKDMTDRHQPNPPLFDAVRFPYLRELVHNPSNTTIVTVLDYRYGRPKSWVEFAKHESESDPMYKHVHRDILVRAARSRGRMELHLVMLNSLPWAPLERRGFMFPQRSDRPAFNEGYLRILKDDGIDDAQEEVERLLAATEDVVKIH